MDEFASPTGINWKGHIGQVQYGTGDRGMVAMFFNKPNLNRAKSAEHGRPIFEDTVFVRIHPPGERLNIVERPAIDADKHRFALQWQQFRDNRQQIPEGTSIDLLYPDQPSVAATLRAAGVHTIEQCAELSGPAIDNVGMGSQKYVNDSKRYIEMANKGVGAAQFRKELDDRDSQIRTLTKTVDKLKNEVERLTSLNSQGVTLETVQQMLSGMQARPQFPVNPGPGFDAQTAQINATHATSELAPKRSRARIKQT